MTRPATPERRDEARSVIGKVMTWSSANPGVRGVLVVGSWARNAARMDSDLDIVVLTGNPGHTDPAVWSDLLGGALIREQDWGPLREVRLRLPTGFEVEMGVVAPSWAALDPVDEGTYRVVHDGHDVIYDPDGLLTDLSTACRLHRPQD